MYKINLDKGNRREKEEVTNIDVFDGFIIERLFSYTAEDLNKARIIALKELNDEDEEKMKEKTPQLRRKHKHVSLISALKWLH